MKIDRINNKIIIAAIFATLIAGATAPAQAASDLRYAQLKNSSAPNIETLDMSAVPKLERGEIRTVQAALRQKGFDPGSINGVINARTKAAVEKFQDRYGIKATGTINNQTLFALGVVGTTAPAVEEDKESKQAPSKPRRATQTPPKAKSIQRSTGRSRWCAAYHNGSQNCGFYSLDQCRAAVSGVGGSCVPD